MCLCLAGLADQGTDQVGAQTVPSPAGTGTGSDYSHCTPSMGIGDKRKSVKQGPAAGGGPGPESRISTDAVGRRSARRLTGRSQDHCCCPISMGTDLGHPLMPIQFSRRCKGVQPHSGTCRWKDPAGQAGGAVQLIAPMAGGARALGILVLLLVDQILPGTLFLFSSVLLPGHGRQPWKWLGRRRGWRRQDWGGRFRRRGLQPGR